MKDVDYVKEMLAAEFKTENPHEIPYPSLDEVIRAASFEYSLGTVDGEKPNGSKSREDHNYLWFRHGKKPILSHRFIVAITIGKWIPRDFDVDHINHNPSDNKPANLRIVTSRDNAGNRRKALLSELVELEIVSLTLKERILSKNSQPKPRPVNINPSPDMSFGSAIPRITYTGETKPAKYGGAWHKTNLGSWHLFHDRHLAISAS